MRSDNSAQRLACPRCRANNFVGQAQCWQCKASLPPPEAINTPTVAGWAQSSGTAPVPTTPVANGGGQAQSPPQWSPALGRGEQTPSATAAPRRGSRTPLVIAGALLTASAVVWFVFHRPAATNTSTPGLSLPPGVSASGTAGVIPDGMLPGSHDIRLAQPDRDEFAPTADPNQAAAQRAVHDAVKRLGLPPGTNSDGSVHLRNGDTISREQYEAAQQKLKEHLLNGPPSVPRL